MTGDVKTELKRLLSDIREKTGCEVKLQSTGGAETKFSLCYCGTQTDAFLDGANREDEAKLISYLVSNTGYGQLLPEKEEYLKSILLGEGNKSFVYRFMSKFNLSDGECYAVEILPERNLDGAYTFIESCLDEGGELCVKLSAQKIAVVKFTDDAQTPLEFGQFLSQSLFEEMGVKAKVGVGCEVKSFLEISSSYAQASTAVRMSELFCSKGTVHGYREYLLIKMLEDIPAEKLQEYMEQFHIENAQSVLSDSEITSTAEKFLENSLNISETSRNLYMHRNTLMYRLDKIERVTGLNIRNFSDAVTFRVITILYKLLQK